jgi:hypothetical protein
MVRSGPVARDRFSTWRQHYLHDALRLRCLEETLVDMGMRPSARPVIVYRPPLQERTGVASAARLPTIATTSPPTLRMENGPWASGLPKINILTVELLTKQGGEYTEYSQISYAFVDPLGSSPQVVTEEVSF